MIRPIILCCLLLGGLYTAAEALWDLGKTAVFVYRAQAVPGTVVDQRERPFHSWGEMMQHGHFPWEGSTAYQPIVKFTCMGRPVIANQIPDLDSRSHENNEQLDLLVDFTRGRVPTLRINEFRFLWGGSLAQFAGGILLLLIFRQLLHRNTGRKSVPSASQEQPGEKKSRGNSAPSQRKGGKKHKKSSQSPKKTSSPRRKKGGT